MQVVECISPNCPYREIVHSHKTDGWRAQSTTDLLLQVQPWLDDVSRDQMRLRYRIDQIVHDLQVEIATLQEQIDEIWQEMRGE